MVKLLLGASALVISAPCVAGPILWRDIEAGMPSSKVRELYPEQPGTIHHKPKLTVIENMQQVGRCHPDVVVEHPNGKVEKVVIRSRYRGFPKETCGQEAAKAMLTKYGAPLDEDGSEQEVGGLITTGLFKGVDTTRTERLTQQTWLRDGVLITFERDDPEVDDRWTITYEARNDIGL